MPIRFGINTGFALNRFTTPEEWMPLVAEEFGLKMIQFTADLLNPSLDDAIISDQIARILRLRDRYHLNIFSTFTSAFTRVNHLSHPDAAQRAYWKKWFLKWVDISAALGAKEVGSHFGILTAQDLKDPKRRDERLRQTVEAWQDIAAYASKKGITQLSWEPMSIAREYGETIPEARRIHETVNRGISIPMAMCFDVDHGDLVSPDPKDTDPYAWIEAFPKEIKTIHLKQSTKDKGGHWPFTPEKNKEGKIQAERLIASLKKAKIDDVTLLLEMSFREREPVDSRVAQDIKASVDYWRPYVSLS